MPVRLRGPADVVGIDANQIVRMDPQPGTDDFEPNYFPCIEFDRPDFPWLFTPARADREREAAAVAVPGGGAQAGRRHARQPPSTRRCRCCRSPRRRIRASSCPTSRESWAWAHAQAAAADSTQPNVRAALAGSPELSLSRLICPRILAPTPTTSPASCRRSSSAARRASAWRSPMPTLIAATALAPAWSLSPAPAQVTLPVYHHWEFRTGVGGDFASLVGRLRPQPAPPASGPPPDRHQPARLRLARRGLAPCRHGPRGRRRAAADPAAGRAGRDADLAGQSRRSPSRTRSPRSSTRRGRARSADPLADPLLAPPLYGRWYAARPTVARTGADWFDQLNLDPRLRSVAAFGTRVVQEHQEALMASAWEQAGELQRANQRLRQLQMSLVVGSRLFARHFAPLSDEAALRVSAPVLSRLGSDQRRNPQSMLAQVRTTAIPAPALSPAMRRIGRQRGPLTRRVAAQAAVSLAPHGWHRLKRAPPRCRS